MITIKNLTTKSEMKVRSTITGFISQMNQKPNCKIIKSEAGLNRYVLVINNILMRLEIL